MNKNNAYREDLLFVSKKVTDALNMFNETVTSENKLLTTYGKDEFIALIITLNKNDDKYGSLRLRTRDMAGTWENVPVGFSQIDECRGLLSSMKKAAKVSLKRNSLWYIDKELKNTIGDRIKFTEISTNKNWLYKVTFENDYTAYITLTREDGEYTRNHDESLLYIFCKKDRTPIGSPLTVDECMLFLTEIALKEDARVAKFVALSKGYGGRSVLTHSYRTEEESFDEAKTVFNNGYALKLRIVNSVISVEVFGTSRSGETYELESRTFSDISDVYGALKDFANASQYEPSTSS